MTSPCGTPPSVAAATVNYNATVAQYSCIAGYSLGGSNEITCSGTTWTGNTPSCTYLQQADDIDTNVNVYDSDSMPTWLLGVLAGLAGVVALLLLVCMTCCIMYMCGCLSGPIFGYGANHVHPLHSEQSSCCCCNKRRRRRGDFYDSRSSSVVDLRRHDQPQGTRIAGFNYTKPKKTYPKVANANDVNSTPDSGVDSTRNVESPTYATTAPTITELVARDKRHKQARQVKEWMPHSHGVRQINTSTK